MIKARMDSILGLFGENFIELCVLRFQESNTVKLISQLKINSRKQ